MSRSPGKVICFRSTVMDCKNADWIKKEETNQFLEDPLGVSWFTGCIEKDPGLFLGWNETENNNSMNMLLDAILEAESECCPPSLLVPKKEPFLGDPFGISWPTDFIKEEPELQIEVDETENIVVTPRRYISISARLNQSSGESCGISFEETVVQRVVNDELEKATTRSTMCGTHTQSLTLEEDSSFDNKLNCSLKEKELLKFNCSVCLQSFPSKYRLIMHVFIHIDGVQPPAYVCKSCGEVCPSYDSLNKHFKMSGRDQALSPGNDVKFYCSSELENTIFWKEDVEFTMAEKIEQESSSHKCDVCEKSFAVLSTLKTHSLTHTRQKPHGCSICGKFFTQSSHLYRHLIIHTGKRPHKCNVCGKSYNRLDQLKIHLLLHTGKRPHKCNVCGKSFSRLNNLKRHALLHSGKRPHKCNICGKSFTVLSHLKRHALLHSGKRPHKCNICGKSCTVLSHLKSHALLHSVTNPHKCPICGESFTESHKLKRHQMIHTGERPNICETCGKSFTLLHHLKRHSLIHTRKRLHMCDICGKSFSLLENLKNHVLIHSGKRPHKCDICGNCFTQLTTLKNHHALIHSGEKPHGCDICGKFFALMSSLKRHSVIHTRKVPTDVVLGADNSLYVGPSMSIQ